MSETDPFSDAAFLGRLQKLLPMMGSEQPGEADAARRKLIEHLGHYRLTLLDVAARLREPPQSARMASFTQASREASLERQLALARQAKDEVAQENVIAGMRIRTLEAELNATTYDIGRMAQSQVRTRGFAVVAWALAAACALLMMRQLMHEPAASAQRIARVEHNAAALPADDDQGDALLHIAPGERRGSAAVQDLAIRLSPNDQATIRAFLNRGEPMAVQQQVRIGAQTWLLVRTSTGTGWVRSGDVMQP